MNFIRNKTLVWLLVLVVGAGIIFWLSYGWKKNADNRLSVSPSVSATPTPSSSNSGKPSGKNKSLTPQEVEKMLNNSDGLTIPTTVPYSQLKGPASCKVAGMIKFLSPTLSENRGAELTYSGIDSPARQIKWKVLPSDKLIIGPNLTSSLKLPDGSSPVGVTLPENPQSKNYKLAASITYGRLVGEGVKVYEANCSGEVEVVLSY